MIQSIILAQALSKPPPANLSSMYSPSIRTLNFAPEANIGWRDMPKVAGFNELSLSWFNSTTSGDSPLQSNDPQNSFDYYTSPAGQLDSVATLSLYQQRPVERQGAATEICGGGWNCTFEVSFTGPGYKCADLGQADSGTYSP